MKILDVTKMFERDKYNTSGKVKKNIAFSPRVNNCLIILTIVCGVLFFMVGLHGIDNAWNIKYVECATGYNFYDTNTYGQAIGKNEMYQQSINTLFFGFFMTVAGCLFFSIYELRSRRTDSERVRQSQR